MSKVSFRARALDATKPMPVYRAEEIPDLPDFANINRSVPAMPTGMEKEEETVHCFVLVTVFRQSPSWINFIYERKLSELLSLIALVDKMNKSN